MKQVLVLDFDGVMADSQMECLFVGFNSYLEFNKKTELFGGQRFTFDNFNALAAKHKKTVDEYKRLRPYVIDAFCYYVIAHIVENNINMPDQESYNRIRDKVKDNIHGNFIRFFYEERQRLIDNNLDKWLELEKPYKKIITAIKKLGNTPAISTNNRKFTIDAFCGKYGIKPMIIIDSISGSDKKVHIEKIKNELKINFEDLYFVDDQLKNFIKVLPLGVKCYLATWGYNTEEQRKEAEKSGAILVSEDNFYEAVVK